MAPVEVEAVHAQAPRRKSQRAKARTRDFGAGGIASEAFISLPPVGCKEKRGNGSMVAHHGSGGIVGQVWRAVREPPPKA